MRDFPGFRGYDAGPGDRKEKEEAVKLAENFFQMIRGTAGEADLEALEEAAALQDIAHMPARVKCAVLGWRTLEEILEGQEN